MRRETHSSSTFGRRILISMLAVALTSLAVLAAPAMSQARAGSPSDCIPHMCAFLSAFAPKQDVTAKELPSLGRLLAVIIVAMVPVGGLCALFRERIAMLLRRSGAKERTVIGSKPEMEPSETEDSTRTLDETREAADARVKELSTFGRVGRIITSSLDLNTLLDDMANHLAEIADGTGCLIILLDPETQLPIPMAAYGEYYDDYHNLELDGGEPSAVMAAMSSQQPVVIRDMNNSSLVAPRLSHRRPDMSMLALPVIVKDRAIGVALVGDNRHIRDFYPDVIEMAVAVANQFAVAIENVRLYESTQRHLHDLSLLYQTSAAISTTLDEGTIFEMAIQAFTKVFDVEACRLIVFEDNMWAKLATETLTRSSRQAGITHIRLMDNAVLESLAENRRPLAIGEEQRELLDSLREFGDIGDILSALVVPLVAKGDVIGCIILITGDARQFNAEEIGLAQTLANQIAGVIQNARLYGQMEEEKRKFELAALNIGEGLIILDREDTLLFANPQAQAMLGLGDSPSLGLPLTTLCPQPQMLELLLTFL